MTPTRIIFLHFQNDSTSQNNRMVDSLGGKAASGSVFKMRQLPMTWIAWEGFKTQTFPNGWGWHLCHLPAGATFLFFFLLNLLVCRADYIVGSLACPTTLTKLPLTTAQRRWGSYLKWQSQLEAAVNNYCSSPRQGFVGGCMFCCINRHWRSLHAVMKSHVALCLDLLE